MSDPPRATSAGPGKGPDMERPPTAGTFTHVRGVWRRMRGAPQRRVLATLTLGLVVVIVLNMSAQIWLNDWQGQFYDALERRDWPTFRAQALRFLLIAGSLLTLVVAQTWSTERIKIHLRAWLTNDLLDDWLVAKRAYLLTFAGEVGQNPDQRVHEDTRHLAELTADLGASLMQAALLLASFVGVLWMLSEQVKFEIDGRLVGIPGYMVWCAVGFALLGSLLTWWVGRPMVDDNAKRYAREADLRFALVRIGESAEGITLYGGEADERHTIGGLFDLVVVAMKRLANDLARLTWVTSGYGWLALVVPVIVAAPGYFSGAMSLGGLMMVVNAFNQVQTSLRWFVDNYSRLADWRATLRRVEALHDALDSLEQKAGRPGHFVSIEDTRDGVRFEAFGLRLPSGTATFEAANVAIERGERVQIVGEMSAGKSTLFLAMAGLWSRGTGAIRHPPRDRMMFLPERPYFPLGSLREALAYPDSPKRFTEDELVGALRGFGLDRLTPCLDLERRWDRELRLDEQQSLAFARLLLHRPEWVVMDDAMSALVNGARRRVYASLAKAKGLSVIGMARVADTDPFWGRVITLKRRNGETRHRNGGPKRHIA